MNKPHKHADLIKAWAEGKPVEVFDPSVAGWVGPLGPLHLWRDASEYGLAPSIRRWQKEREAFARGERIQWRSTCKQHAGMAWIDVPAQSPLMGPAFDEPTNEFRIPHKWQTEMDAHARGETVQYRDFGPWADLFYRGKDWVDFDRNTDPNPVWATTATREYRIKPKIVKTRVRVAAMGEPNGKGRIWVWPVYTDEHAAQTERNRHFLCWLGDWHEVERPEPPVEDALSVGYISAAKISSGTIDDGKSPLGELHAMGFGPAKRCADRTVVWYPNGGWARWL